MEESRKDKIVANLQQAKETGQLKTSKIREIIRTAIKEATSEAKQGTAEINTLIKEAISAVSEMFQDKQGEIKEELTATIEGAIEGINDARRESIDKTQTEINQLQTQVDKQEIELQKEIDGVLEDLQTDSQETSEKVKQSVAEIIRNLENSEEFALLQKRYAQLKAQLAVVQANLANRYGENYIHVNRYLNEAKVWYEKAKDNPEVFTGKIEAKQQEFETKLGETGVAIAKKEKQVKLLLKELWQSISHLFRDK